MMTRAMILFVLAALPITTALAQDEAAPEPFAELAGVTLWGPVHAQAFQAERRRLGERFDRELMGILGDNLTRHYMATVFLTRPERLDGLPARPRLAAMICEQGITLSGQRNDEDAWVATIALSIQAALIYDRLGLLDRAAVHKQRAEDFLVALPRLVNDVSILPADARAIYQAIGTPDQLSSDDILLDGEQSIQAMIDAAPDGATITIPRARYISQQSIIVQARHDLTIICPRGTEILVDDVDEHVVTITESTGITIQGAHLRHKAPAADYECHGAVVRAEGSSELHFVDSDLHGCGAIGLSAHECQNILVSRCSIRENSYVAISLNTCENVMIAGNIITDNQLTLSLRDCRSVRMQDNLITGNGGFWDQANPQPGPREVDLPNPPSED